MRRKQLEFNILKRPKDEFGGSLLTSHPKGRRPLASKLPIHLTLRAKKSVLRLPRVYGAIELTLTDVAKKYGVKIYKHANVGNHLHLAIKLRQVSDWAGFIRELTGRIALLCRRFVTDGLWMYRPHTRIVRGWRKAYRIVLDYIELNQLEGEGQISRRQVKTLADLRRLMASG